MQLPPATAAAPRLPSSGPAGAPHSGSAAGFDAVMGGVLASGAAASRGKPSGAKDQPASDDGGPGKPATDAAPAAGACAPSGPAIAGIASGSAVPRGLTPGLMQGFASTKKVVSAVAATHEATAGTVETGNVEAVAVGLSSGGPGLETAPATLPKNEPALSGNALPSMTSAASVPAPSGSAAFLAGNPTGNPSPSTADPGPIQPAAIQPAAIQAGPIQTGPIQPDTAQSRSARPGPAQAIAASTASPTPAGFEVAAGPANTEAPASAAAAVTGEAGTAVVLPRGKPGTQQDPQVLGGQGTPATAGIQAGMPAPVQAASPLPQVPSGATPGAATPGPQADPAKLLPQVSGPLFSLAAGEPGRHVMTLRLSPEDLGPLTVRAHIDGAGVRIELFAPGEAGREAVRSILPELRRGLGESGFGASLDLSEHNAPADAGASGSDARDRRPAGSPALPRGSDGEPVRLPRTAVVLPRSSTTSLDILV